MDQDTRDTQETTDPTKALSLPQTTTMPHHMYERLSLSVRNLLRGEVDASLRSILSPDTLSPSEHFLVEQTAGQRSPAAELLKASGLVLLHPLVVMGILLHTKYPIAKAKDMFKVVDGAVATGKTLDSITRFFSTPRTIFRKYPDLVEALWGVSARSHEFRTTYSEKFHVGTEKFIKLVGRQPNSKESTIAALLLDGADEASTPGYQNIARVLSKDKFGEWGNTSLVKPLEQMDLPASVRSGIREMVKNDRKVLNDIFGLLKGASPEEQDNIERIARRMGLEGMLGDRVERYWVHRISNYKNIFDEIPKTPEEYAAVVRGTDKVLSRSMMKRTGNPSLPNLEELDRLGPGVVNQRYLESMKRWAASHEGRSAQKLQSFLDQSNGDIGTQTKNLRLYLQEEHGMSDTASLALSERIMAMKQMVPAELKEFVDRHKGLYGGILEYGVHRERDLSSYLAGAAPQVAWSTSSKLMPGGLTYGEVIAQHAKRMPAGPHQDILVKDYIPAMRGLKSFRDAENYNKMWFNDFRMKLKETLEHPSVKKVIGSTSLGRSVNDKMLEHLNRGDLSLMNSGISGEITKWIYQGALGGNIGSSLKNLTQSVLTPIPLLGMYSVREGMTSLSRKMPLYLRELGRARKMFDTLEEADDFATRKIFPEFKSQDNSPFTKFQDYALQDGKNWITGVRGLLDKTTSFSMMPFMATERFNRLLAFESGLLKGVREGMSREEATRFASEVVHYTQFPGGILGTPHGTLRLNPMFRQFTQFPLRMVDFLWSSTGFGVGGGKSPLNLGPLGKVNPGTIGRVMLSSGLAYPFAKYSGVDLSSALAEGAIPTPNEPGTPFFPSPLVPPALGMIGGLGSAAVTGDTSKLGSQLAPIIPMGIALRRLNKFVGPQYARYDQRTADGKIPVFDNNQKFLGNFSPASLVAQSMGIQLTGAQQEQAFVEYMAKQSKILKQFRSDYLGAMASNDISKATTIQAEYQKKYPQLGPLRVKQEDIQSLSKRQELTRFQRLLQSMPKETQPLYQLAYSSVLGANLSDFGGTQLDQGGLPQMPSMPAVPTLPGYGQAPPR